MKFTKSLIFFLLINSSISLADLPESWLDLQGGGQAVGPAQTIERKNPDGSVTPWEGSLLNGTLLPASGDGFVRLNSPDNSWGAGVMITLLEHSTAFYAKNFSNGFKIYVASIAQEHGGGYGPHKSHENGLDADILYMGQTKYGTVLDSDGKVSAQFDPQKNWDYWRLLLQQQITENNTVRSVVYMIFVHPVIKDYLCAWAKEKNMLADPVNAELMRRLRRTAGHDTHFHLRLRCSPYYQDCYQQGDIAAGPGCDENVSDTGISSVNNP
jgi:penicillin-insensitive murein endopeptidase